MILGPVGVGKTFMATALGHAAVRRRYSVHFCRADVLLKRLRAPGSTTATTPRCANCYESTFSILDDFASTPRRLDTADIYELIVERHRHAATVTTSNREPIEWLAQMADALLAQSAIDRLQSAAYELVLEGESYRRRQKPSPGDPAEPSQRRRRRARPRQRPGRNIANRRSTPGPGPMQMADRWSHQVADDSSAPTREVQ